MTCTVTNVYARAVEEEFRYGLDTWDMLTERAIDWQEVDFVLKHAHPKLRRHIGAHTLKITALDRANRWLAVTCVEVDGLDEVYDIIDARYVNDNEIDQASGKGSELN